MFLTLPLERPGMSYFFDTLCEQPAAIDPAAHFCCEKPVNSRSALPAVPFIAESKPRPNGTNCQEKVAKSGGESKY